MPNITISNNTEPTVIEMALCEASRVILHPDQLYRFVVMPGCAECERLASVYTQSNKDTVSQ